MFDSYHHLIAIPVIATVVILSTISFVYAAEQPSPAMELLQPNEDAVPSKLREARGAMFDSMAPFHAPRVQDTDPGAPPLVTSATRRAMEELPVGLSDAVVIGSVSKAQPFLSNNGKIIYTELVVQVTESLYDRFASRSVPYRIAIVEPGGAVRLGSDRIVRHEIHGYGDWPKSGGGPYVFFLMYNVPADCYALVKTWRFKNGHSVPMAVDDKVRASRGESRYSGLDENTFKLSVLQAVKRP